MRGPSPRRRGGPLLRDEGREAVHLAAERNSVSAWLFAILPQLRGSFRTRDAASPAPPGSVPKVGSPVFDRAKIPRPKRRGLRGNMVPFPAALCAAGTPMGWTLVAPFLELPPSCAALAALANRARPAVRCRTAFPQKCRDGGPGGTVSLPLWHASSVPPGAFSLGPLQRPVLFSAAKPPRPIWAAPQVRRSTQGAPVWGDRSLSNHCMGSSLYARETLAGRFTKPTPRPKRRGLRGNMVPPSNRARPAVRCRTAFPQKCRDSGPPLRCAQWGTKENGGLGALPPGKNMVAAFGRINRLGRATRGTFVPSRGLTACRRIG